MTDNTFPAQDSQIGHKPTEMLGGILLNIKPMWCGCYTWKHEKKYKGLHGK